MRKRTKNIYLDKHIDYIDRDVIFAHAQTGLFELRFAANSWLNTERPAKLINKNTLLKDDDIYRHKRNRE